MKKTLFSLLTMTLASGAFAQSYTPRDYKQSFNDITEDGLTKEQLFNTMDRSLMRMSDSICSNRALMWLWDIKDKFNVDAGKVFVFYTTGKFGAVGRTDWWYHVAPVVNESGKLWVMEGAFPDIFNAPITKERWFKAFTGSDKCREIGAEETELVKLMFSGKDFPAETSYGKFDCYYKIVPSGYWMPSSVAMNILGVDQTGKPVSFVRDQMNNSEVYSACMEAANSSFGTFLGSKKKKCKEFAGIR